MTRDYKNVTEANTKKKSRVKSKKIGEDKALPGWVWLVSGVVIGGFVSFILYLKLSVPVDAVAKSEVAEKQVNAAHKIAEKPALTPKVTSKLNAENPAQKKQDDSELEFYKILTDRKPIFPENKTEKQDTDVVKTEKQAQKPAVTETSHVRKEKIESPKKYIYTLQVGSFLAFKDADKRKANLAMLGIGSRIHAIKSRNVTHYRVMVGPYDDFKRINKIDVEMKANNIKTLLLRERG